MNNNDMCATKGSSFNIWRHNTFAERQRHLDSLEIEAMTKEDG